MNDVQRDDAGPMIVWQNFTPLPDTVRREEELQGALRGDMALIEEAEKKATAWMDRRRVSFESGLKALGDMAACKDPVSAVAICSWWLSGSMGRIAADLQDAQDFAIKATALGQQTARAMAVGFSPSGRATPVRVAGAA
jgi:hypothetical protein